MFYRSPFGHGGMRPRGPAEHSGEWVHLSEGPGLPVEWRNRDVRIVDRPAGEAMVSGGWSLAVDFGTSNTAAAYRVAGGAARAVRLTDQADQMPSAVLVAPDGVKVGVEAVRSAQIWPAGFEPAPKSRMGEGELWLALRTLLFSHHLHTSTHLWSPDKLLGGSVNGQLVLLKGLLCFVPNSMRTLADWLDQPSVLEPANYLGARLGPKKRLVIEAGSPWIRGVSHGRTTIAEFRILHLRLAHESSDMSAEFARLYHDLSSDHTRCISRWVRALDAELKIDHERSVPPGGGTP